MGIRAETAEHGKDEWDWGGAVGGAVGGGGGGKVGEGYVKDGGIVDDCVDCESVIAA